MYNIYLQVKEHINNCSQIIKSMYFVFQKDGAKIMQPSIFDIYKRVFSTLKNSIVPFLLKNPENRKWNETCRRRIWRKTLPSQKLFTNRTRHYPINTHQAVEIRDQSLTEKGHQSRTNGRTRDTSLTEKLFYEASEKDMVSFTNRPKKVLNVT